MKNCVLSRSQFIIALLMALYSVLAIVSSTSAQSPALAVGILTPAEGETFYAGPQVLQYSMQITGWASSGTYKPTQLEVRLQVFQGANLVGALSTHADADGSFMFALSVNPGANGGQSIFNPEHDICPSCHYPSDMAAPAGPSLLRVTVIDPAQAQASAERHIIVDRSTQATVPIRVIDPGSPDRAVANVRITGSARLYMWRTRNASAITDAAGQAVLRLEVLTQVPTQYVFFVEPTVVDGVLYRGAEPITVTLAAGQTSAALVTLPVHSQMGHVSGSLGGTTNKFPVPIRAVRAPDGKSFSTQLSANGAFEFSDLPIGKYIITADHDKLTAAGLSFADQSIDLAATPAVSVTLKLATIDPGETLTGSVRDAKGAPIPFAWVSADPTIAAKRTAADSGAFTLANLPRGTSTVVVSAPGFYSQIRVVDPSTAADFALTRRPETRVLPWGSGEVVAPPESQITIDQQDVSLTQGWLWGAGSDNDHPLAINLPDSGIKMQSGRFALEYFSGRPCWLFVMEGAATVRSNQTQATATVRGGEMLALTSASLVPVPLDTIAVAALRPAVDPPLAVTWEPSLDAQIRDRLARMGIGAAQSTAFVTYTLAVLSLVAVPLLLVISWWKRRRGVKSR